MRIPFFSKKTIDVYSVNSILSYKLLDIILLYIIIIVDNIFHEISQILCGLTSNLNAFSYRTDVVLESQLTSKKDK
jgi:hypothetical protein